MKLILAVLLGAASTIVFTTSAGAQEVAKADTQSEPAGLEAIVVTGTRLVVDGTKAPTPVTVLTTQQLLTTTPSNLADGLNSMPQFVGSSSQNTPFTNSTNATGNVLNLRNFGQQRTLVLLDGMRVPPTTAEGTVDINVLPQSLIQRVDVVTGGASAVYGSDAITGVVNFVLDTKFNGIKTTLQTGTSSRGDDGSVKAGLTAGTSLFAENGHVEFSYEHYDSRGVSRIESRPNGSEDWVAAGNGTAANPFHLVENGRLTDFTAGSVIVAGPASLVGQNFTQNGILSPFVHGTPSGSANTESGGDGGLFNSNWLVAPLQTDQAFARFDYDFGHDISTYAQFGLSQSQTHASYQPYWTVGFPGTILSGNAFLPASVQQALTASGASSFNISRADDRDDTSIPPLATGALVTNIFGTTGLEGKVFGLKWNLDYSYGQTTTKVSNFGNINSAKLSAALDAVVNPATGRVVCEVSLTQYASRFPGCIPLNLFGPTAPNLAAAEYTQDDTWWKLLNSMHTIDVGIAGSLFSTWAGPVELALSAEYREQLLQNTTTNDPNTMEDCTGLRTNCTPTTPEYLSYSTAAVRASEKVGEVAFETEVPLVSGVKFVDALDVNGAARFTDYSTSGSVETWKVGLNYSVDHQLRFRATRSQDIRAPTLMDLYQPKSSSPAGFNDQYTNSTGIVQNITEGNPNLKPEVAQTLTAGGVYQPDWLTNFSASVDYYSIKVSQAIITVGGGDPAVQAQCIASKGTSPYCALYDRPFGFGDTSPANYPTSIFSQPLNVASYITHGVDTEMSYHFPFDRIVANAPGDVSLRSLMDYQPILTSQTITGGPIQESAGIAGQVMQSGLAKWRGNVNLAYAYDAFKITLVERWKSGEKPYAPPIVYTIPNAPAYFYTDMTVEMKVAKDMDVGLFLSVQNLFDRMPPLFGGLVVAPGLQYPSSNDYDTVGTYFTAGVKAKF